MTSSIDSGGQTHIRYGHTSRPRLIEVGCPSCNGLARATKPSESNLEGEIVSDLSPTYGINDWEVCCLHCPKRIAGLSYKELPKLFYFGGALDVWAWNTDHANCMIDLLNGKDVSENQYAWFMTYVRGVWKRNSKKTVSELGKLHNKASNHTHGCAADCLSVR